MAAVGRLQFGVGGAHACRRPHDHAIIHSPHPRRRTGSHWRRPDLSIGPRGRTLIWLKAPLSIETIEF